MSEYIIFDKITLGDNVGWATDEKGNLWMTRNPITCEIWKMVRRPTVEQRDAELQRLRKDEQ